MLYCFVLFLRWDSMHSSMASRSLCSWKMTLNLLFSCLYLLSAVITDLCHHFRLYLVLGIQLRALCMIGNHSTNWEITLTLFLKITKDQMFLTLIFTKMVIYHLLKLFFNVLVSENLYTLKSY